MLLTKSFVSAVVIVLATSAAASDPIRNIPASNLDWATTPEGVAFAALVGDRFAEPYMAMVSLPAGLVSPAHVKTAAMYGVIVSGTMTHVRLGNDEASTVLLQEGSFYHIPAHVPHISSCVSDTACVSFLYQDGKFDFLPVDQ